MLNQTHVFEVRFEERLPQQEIEINGFSRHSLFEMDEFDLVSCLPIKGSELVELEEVTIEVVLMAWSKERISINTEDLELQLKNKRMLAN